MPPALGYATSAADTATDTPARAVLTIDALAANLARTFRDRADVKIETGDGFVRVGRLSARGPDVAANLVDGRCTLSIGGWHDEMQSLDVAADYIKMAVAGQLRVRVDRLGGKPWQIALERRLDDGSWQEESGIRFPRFNPFRRGKTTEYLQNI